MSRHNRERRERAAGKLPPVNRVPLNLDGQRFHNILEYGVACWHPLPDGKGVAEAVALHLTADMGAEVMKFCLRLKSVRAVDELIAMLERHRNLVWPGAE